jgi:hypothetical protein
MKEAGGGSLLFQLLRPPPLLQWLRGVWKSGGGAGGVLKYTRDRLGAPGGSVMRRWRRQRQRGQGWEVKVNEDVRVGGETKREWTGG